jgi:hypothetical protein
MTGEKALNLALNKQSACVTEVAVQPEGMKQFSDLVNPDFITKMENVVTPQDVCKIMNVPISAMRVFASTLNPAFDLERDLGGNFKDVVIALLSERKEREKQRPIRKLFGMGVGEEVSEEGAVLEIEIGN